MKKTTQSSFVPGKNVNAHRYFDTEINLMLQKQYENETYDPLAYHYDALLRTARAYLTWKKPEMKQGMISCFRKFKMIDKDRNKYWYQGSRSANRFQEDDVSRDQISGFFYSMIVNGDREECLEIMKHTPFRLSRKFRMSLDMWLWVKAVQGNKFAGVLWYLISIFILTISLHVWNRFVNFILGYKEISQTNYRLEKVYEKHSKYNSIQKFLDKALYPSYVTHHMCWYLACMPSSFLKKCVQKIIFWQVEKENYVERILCGDKTVTLENVNSYIPMTEYRWSTKLDGNSLTPIKIPNASEINLIEQLKVNQLDKDLLFTLWERNHLKK